MRCEHLERVSQLVDDELERAEAARLRAHIIECAICQSAEADFLLSRQQLRASAIFRDESAHKRALTAILATGRERESGRTLHRYLISIVQPRYAVACVILCLMLAISSFLYLNYPSSLIDTSPAIVSANSQAWNVARLAGVPSIGASSITESARLNVGEWLVTDEASRAQIDVADIGHVEVDPNSRLRLVATNESEHRLALAQGKISALIYAPPRLFFVDTPSAVAVDYGCAYTLEVDERGRSILHVTSGWVALEAEGGESFVPAGASCVTEKGSAPGTPHRAEASARFIDALAEIDFSDDIKTRRDALNVILDEANRKRDALTLWHLLARVEGGDRARTFERLNHLVTVPAGVTREGILRLDHEMLNQWKDRIETAWYEDGV
jgi:hypothetical protein